MIVLSNWIGAVCGIMGIGAGLWRMANSPKALRYSNKSSYAGKSSWYWALRDPYYWALYVQGILLVVWVCSLTIH